MVSSFQSNGRLLRPGGTGLYPLVNPDLLPHHVANNLSGLFVHPDVSHLSFRVADGEFIDLFSFFGLELAAVYGSFNSF